MDAAENNQLSGAQGDLKEAQEHIDDAQETLEAMAKEAEKEKEGEVELHRLVKEMGDV
jgi:F0F1-type ATP synthase membrane subunit b/b'